MEKINIENLLGPCKPRQNFNLFWVDDQYTLRVAKVKGTFPWHHHPSSDEGWFVFRGQVTIQSEQGNVTLTSGEAVLIPKGLVHAPHADIENSVVMIINSRTFQTIFRDDLTPEAVGYSETDVAS